MVTAPDIASRTTPLTTLRMVAVIGSILALGLVGLAFSWSLLLGIVALAAAPVVPLGLVVGADRLLRR